MGKSLTCIKCGIFLGELNKGKIHLKAVLLCNCCWEKALAAISMAELAASQNTKPFDKDLKGFMDMLGLK